MHLFVLFQIYCGSVGGETEHFELLSQNSRRRFTLFWQRVPTNEPADNSAAQQEQHQMEVSNS